MGQAGGGGEFEAAYGYGIAVDSAGNSYITGYFFGTATFGAGEANETTLTSSDGSADLFVAKYSITTIDIKTDMSLTTHEDPTINTKSKGVVAVSILGNAHWDIENVNVTVLPTFGPDGATPIHNLHQEDVNGDGYLDLVMHFKIKDTSIQRGDTEACLTFTVDTAESYTMCHGIRAR